MSVAGEVAAAIVILVIAGSIIAVWYASQREESGDFEYLLSYWFGGLPGLFAYREYRAANPQDIPAAVRHCPHCGTNNDDSRSYCGNCGNELDESDEMDTTMVNAVGQLSFCGHCDAELTADETTCPSCGRAIVEL